MYVEIYLDIIQLIFGKFGKHLIIQKLHFFCNAHSHTEDTIFYT